jgi:hypothetical protein
VTRCFGLWPTAVRLIAVALDAHARPGRPIVVQRTALARRAMLDFFASLPEVDIVLADNAFDGDLRRDSFDDVLRAPNHRVWLAPAALAEAISSAAGQRASPARLAAILARLPAIPHLRREIRRLGVAHVQLDLLTLR